MVLSANAAVNMTMGQGGRDRRG